MGETTSGSRAPRRVSALAVLLLTAGALVALPGTPARAVVQGPTTSPLPAGSAPRTTDSSWPVGSRTGVLARKEGATPTGPPTRQLKAVRVAQKRAPSTIQATIRLVEAPSRDSNSRIRVAFGTIAEEKDGPVCQTEEGAYVDIHTFDVEGTGTSGNPAYEGRKITIKPAHLAAAHDAPWSCAFATVLNSDTSTVYDSFSGALTDRIQKPRLTFVVPSRKLRPSGYTRIPIKIFNSDSTIATAPRVRLKWRTRGVSLRADAKVGTIKPGNFRKGYFHLKRTRRGPGTIVFTAVSRDYRASVTVRIRTS